MELNVPQLIRSAVASGPSETPYQARQHLVATLAEQLDLGTATLWQYHRRCQSLQLLASFPTPAANIPPLLSQDDWPHLSESLSGALLSWNVASVPLPPLWSRIDPDAVYAAVLPIAMRHSHKSFLLCTAPQSIPDPTLAAVAELLPIVHEPVNISFDQWRLRLESALSALPTRKSDRASYLHTAVTLLSTHLHASLVAVAYFDPVLDAFRVPFTSTRNAGHDAPQIRRSNIVLSDTDALMLRLTPPTSPSEPIDRRAVRSTPSLEIHGHELQLILAPFHEVLPHTPTSLIASSVIDTTDGGRTLGLIVAVDEYSRLAPSTRSCFSALDRDLLVGVASVLGPGLRYYHERQQMQHLFSVFLHETRAQAGSILEKLDRLDQPEAFGESLLRASLTPADRLAVDMYETARGLHLGDIRAYANSLLHTAQLVATYDVEQPDARVEREPIDYLHQVVHPAIATARVAAKRLGAPRNDVSPQGAALGPSIRCLPSRLRAAVCVDPSVMNLVLSNLLMNAIKYRRLEDDASSDFRTILYWDMDWATHMLHTYVADNGIGIDVRYTTRVFARGYRTREAKAQAFGTGLGLFLCEAYARSHGGGIEVLDPLLWPDVLREVPLRTVLHVWVEAK